MAGQRGREVLNLYLKPGDGVFGWRAYEFNMQIIQYQQLLTLLGGDPKRHVLVVEHGLEAPPERTCNLSTDTDRYVSDTPALLHYSQQQADSNGHALHVWVKLVDPSAHMRFLYAELAILSVVVGLLYWAFGDTPEVFFVVTLIMLGIGAMLISIHHIPHFTSKASLQRDQYRAQMNAILSDTVAIDKDEVSE